MNAIVLHELIYYIKNPSEASKFIGLFVSIIILNPFSQESSSFINQQLNIGFLLIALASCITLSGSFLFQRDEEAGMLAYYQCRMGTLWGYIFAKWMAFFCSVTIPLFALLPVIALLVDIPVGVWPKLGLCMFLCSLPLTLLISLGSALLTGMDRAGAVLGLLMLPLSIPVVIFGAAYLNSAASVYSTEILFLVGYSLILLPITLYAGAFSLRNAH